MRFDGKRETEGTLNFDFKRERNTLIIYLSGNMDSLTAPEFTKVMEDMISKGEESFIINLNGIGHLSSAGLRNFLLMLQKVTGMDRRMSFVSMNEDINRVFKTAGLYNSLMKIYDTEDMVFDSLR
jgi:anti-anti-sigma factor